VKDHINDAPMANEQPPAEAEITSQQSFLARWSKRKRQGEGPRGARAAQVTDSAPEPVGEPAPTDADMPSLESLDERSDLSPFFSPGVSQELRRLALRKLFHLPRYHARDGLDDYDDDYTRFRELGDTVTAEMRYRAEVESRRLARAAMDQSRASEEISAVETDTPALPEAEEVQQASTVDAARPSASGEEGSV